MGRQRWSEWGREEKTGEINKDNEENGGEKGEGGEPEHSRGSLECGESRVDAHAGSPSPSPSLSLYLSLTLSLTHTYTHMLTHSASLQQRKPIGWSQNPKRNP